MRCVPILFSVLFCITSSKLCLADSSAESAANIIMKLCIAGGEESILIKTTGSAINVSGEVVLERNYRGLVAGISNEITEISSKQASEARACTQKYLERVLQVLLGPSKFVPNEGTSSEQESDAFIIRECDRYAAAPGNADNPNGMRPVFYEHLDIKGGLRACSRALSRAGSSPRIKYQLARVENKAGQFQAAAQKIDELLAINYPPAFGERGDNLQYGDGVPKDISAAISMYKRGVEVGGADSARALASIYRDGKGVKVNFQQAIKYAEIAYKLGNPQAAYILGAMYREGQGVKVDYFKSRALLVEATTGGAVQGQFSLAALQDEGKGGDRDPDAAGQNLFRALQFQTFDAIVERILDYQTGPDAWTVESMKSLQKELAAVGYYSGPIDGVVGSATKEAIENYYNR